MSKRKLLAGVCFLAFIFHAGPVSAVEEIKTFPGAPDVKLIHREDLARKIEKKEPVQIVNVLSPDYYKWGMIKGSKKIPLDELDGRIEELDKKIDVVVYCANPMCTASRDAARDLARKGFRVFAYEGGIEEWKKAGLPLEDPAS